MSESKAYKAQKTLVQDKCGLHPAYWTGGDGSWTTKTFDHDKLDGLERIDFN